MKITSDRLPNVQVILPKGGVTGKGARVIIDGVEFRMLREVKFSGGMAFDGLRVSKLELTFIGDVIVQREADDAGEGRERT